MTSGDRPEGREAVARKLWEQARSEYDYDWDSNADQFRREADELIPIIAAAVRAPLEERVTALEAALADLRALGGGCGYSDGMCSREDE